MSSRPSKSARRPAAKEEPRSPARALPSVAARPSSALQVRLRFTIVCLSQGAILCYSKINSFCWLKKKKKV